MFSTTALPAEPISIGLRRYRGVELQLTLDGEPAGSRDDNTWTLRAPDTPGLYRLRVRRSDTGDQSELQLWVLRPVEEMQGENLGEYRIGMYPQQGGRGANYAAPRGFIEVTPGLLDTQVSDHFSLRQFLCKQRSGFPKYVIIQESLLLLLERLLEEVQARGFEVETFGIISGYRTPFYNKQIGNVAYSRHIYGDAMDIFIDADGDGRMDDLNGDGHRNADDINMFYDLVNSVKLRPENAQLVGGVGRYNKTSRHGGFVHVDTRGYRARW